MYNRAWTNRQKILIILTVITFGILVWQIYALVHSDLSPSRHINNPVSNTNATLVPPNNSSSLSTSSTNSAPITSSSTNNSGDTQNMGNNTPEQVDQLPAQIYQNRASLSPNQEEYMRYSRQFELAKMQRRLLEEQVAIANARKSIADTEQQTNKLLGNNNNFAELGQNDWRLTFLSLRNNQWHATIVHNGDYHNVIEGSKLLDGTKILQINKSGVRLEYHGLTKHLSFIGIKTLTHKDDDSEDEAGSTTSLIETPLAPNQQTGNSLPSAVSTKSKTPAVPVSALPNFQQSNSETVTSPSAAIDKLSQQLDSLKNATQPLSGSSPENSASPPTPNNDPTH